MASPQFFQDDQCPRRPFTLKWLFLLQALAEQQGSSASAIVLDGLQRAPSFQQQPKGSCKILFENNPSGFSTNLEVVGSSWHWVFDSIDSEDNRGKGIDHKI